MSNIAWALATAGHQDDTLFEKLLAHCMADINAYDVQVRVLRVNDSCWSTGQHMGRTVGVVFCVLVRCFPCLPASVPQHN